MAKKNTWDHMGSFGKPTLTLWFFVPSWWALPMSVETTNDQVRWEELQFAEKRWELFILKNESNPSIWKRTENFYSFWSPSWVRWIMKKNNGAVDVTNIVDTQNSITSRSQKALWLVFQHAEFATPNSACKSLHVQHIFISLKMDEITKSH